MWRVFCERSHPRCRLQLPDFSCARERLWRMMSLASVALLCVAVFWGSAPQGCVGQQITVNISTGTIYSTALSCPSTIYGMADCMPAACYWSGSRSQCCMYTNKTGNGHMNSAECFLNLDVQALLNLPKLWILVVSKCI